MPPYIISYHRLWHQGAYDLLRKRMRPGQIEIQRWVSKANIQSDKEKEEKWEKINSKILQNCP